MSLANDLMKEYFKSNSAYNNYKNGLDPVEFIRTNLLEDFTKATVKGYQKIARKHLSQKVHVKTTKELKDLYKFTKELPPESKHYSFHPSNFNNLFRIAEKELDEFDYEDFVDDIRKYRTLRIKEIQRVLDTLKKEFSKMDVDAVFAKTLGEMIKIDFSHGDYTNPKIYDELLSLIKKNNGYWDSTEFAEKLEKLGKGTFYQGAKYKEYGDDWDSKTYSFNNYIEIDDYGAVAHRQEKINETAEEEPYEPRMVQRSNGRWKEWDEGPSRTTRWITDYWKRK